MKLSKEQVKDVCGFIQNKASENGYKNVSSSFYNIKNDIVSCVDYVIVDGTKIHYRISIKKITYDDYFWDIMQMPENKRSKESLRIEGAFAAPSICIYSDDLALDNNFEDIATTFIEQCNILIENFLTQNPDISQYIITNQTDVNDTILISLAFLDIGNVESAKKIATEEIEDDEIGWFENKGKGYFEWLLEFV